MPSSRAPSHDPFVNPPVPASTSLTASSLRNQTAQHSVQPSASTASGRARPQRDYLAPTHLRRPTRNNPRLEDNILADTESEQEPTVPRRRPHLRKIRNTSPDARTRLRQRQQQQTDEADIVNRKPDGSYLLDDSAPAAASVMPPATYSPDNQDEQFDEVDAYYSVLAKKYFTSGAHMNTRLSKQAESDFEQDRTEMVLRLREEAMQKIEDERWLYEASESF